MAQTKAHHRILDLSRYYVPIYFFCLLGVSLTIGFITLIPTFVKVKWDLPEVPAEQWSILALNVLLSAAVGELATLISRHSKSDDKIDALSGEIGRESRKIEKIALANQQQHDASLKITQLFYRRGRFAHDAVTNSLVKLINTFHIEDDKIEFASEYLSRVAFENFWRVLIEEQLRRREQGREPLVVRAAHSASVKLWGNKNLKTLMSLQTDFIKAGGRVFRFLVHSHGSSEEPKDYIPILNDMRRAEIRAFYLDKRATGERHPAPHDFALIHYKETPYVFAWKAAWNQHDEQGDIEGSLIVIGATKYEEYKHRWDDNMSAMWAKKRVQDSATKPKGDLLLDVPTDDEMKMLA